MSTAARGIDWDAQPLGKVRDVDLARALGVTDGAVNSARKRRGIPALPKSNIDWDEQPLGKVSDRELAERLGVAHSTVKWARERRSIPAFQDYHSRPKGIDWRRVPIGTAPDTKLSQLLGVSAAAVNQARTRRVLPRYTRPPAGRIHEIDWRRFPLGQVPDAEVAKLAQASPTMVMRARQRLGIGPFRPAPAKNCRKLGIDWNAQPLGQVLDRILAQRLGVSTSLVAKARATRGIRPVNGWRRRRQCPRPEGGLFQNAEAFETLRVSVLAALDDGPLRFRELEHEVNDDYGSIAENFLRKALRLMRDAGDIELCDVLRDDSDTVERCWRTLDPGRAGW